jgi:hypothetical protein
MRWIVKNNILTAVQRMVASLVPPQILARIYLKTEIQSLVTSSLSRSTSENKQPNKRFRHGKGSDRQFLWHSITQEACAEKTWKGKGWWKGEGEGKGKGKR